MEPGSVLPDLEIAGFKVDNSFPVHPHRADLTSKEIHSCSLDTRKVKRLAYRGVERPDNMSLFFLNFGGFFQGERGVPHTNQTSSH